ncbi:MAG TPA: radical SAM protein [Candidatus Brocadiia bacterium]|nr:radical SAM protein [Candidatus Brocadiia bacterium]
MEPRRKPLLLLVQPAPDKDRLGSNRRRKSSVPRLNLPLLAAHADKDFDVIIADETVQDIDFGIKPDLVGISVLTQTSLRAFKISETFRKGGAKVVMGGIHATFFPDESEKYADAIVMCEAEVVWPQLLSDFLNGGMKKRYKADAAHDMAGLPRPRLDLLKRDAYTFPNIIETARGCPHNCAYCAVTLYWGGKFRFRPVDEVIAEVRSMPPGEIIFVDDNIIGSPKRAKELFRKLAPLRRNWHSQADMKIAKDPELLELCAASGCKWLFMGIESVNEESIASVGKSRVNVVEDYAKSIATIQAAGIKVFGSFIFGLDHDDTSVFEKTVRFCNEAGILGANFYILTPMPFTKLYDEMEAAGRILHRDWSRYDMNHVVFKPAKMTPEELLQGYIGAYASFYSAPAILRRMARPIKGWGQVLALNVGRRLNFKRFREGCMG